MGERCGVGVDDAGALRPDPLPARLPGLLRHLRLRGRCLYLGVDGPFESALRKAETLVGDDPGLAALCVVEEWRRKVTTGSDFVMARCSRPGTRWSGARTSRT